MKTIVGIIIMSHFLTSCVLSKKSEGDSNSFKTLTLGDSYTIGQSVSDSESFPFQWVNKMRESNKKCADPEIVAQTGWRTDQLMQAIIDRNLKSKSFDLVSLLIGVNNEFQGESLAVYEKDFIELVLKSCELAKDNGRVIVISIPDYGFSPYGKPRQSSISKRIDLFNASNKRIADSMNVAYLDITPHSRKAKEQPNLIADDGLHPSAIMYEFWAENLMKWVNDNQLLK